MASKIFVSYKHKDYNVYPINGGITTARDYVDELMKLFEGDEIYKGERDEDLSRFKNETIRSHLRDKIYDSSVTLVLISPNMKDPYQLESDQWIPWEVSYSLKNIVRNGRTSLTNGILAVVLPDHYSSYSYFLKDHTCDHCRCTILETGSLFQILKDNMFNIKEDKCSYYTCPNRCSNIVFYRGQPSYIGSVKWCDFIQNKEIYLQMAEERRDKIDDYEIRKMV